jgi:hypothetical protein
MTKMLNRLFNNKITISLLKWTIILFLINLFIVDPVIKGFTRSLNSIQDKSIVKIISLDLIGNPLTFIRLSTEAIKNNNIDNAELYIKYAEVLESRYNYPLTIKNDITSLKAQVKKIKDHR